MSKEKYFIQITDEIVISSEHFSADREPRRLEDKIYHYVRTVYRKDHCPLPFISSPETKKELLEVLLKDLVPGDYLPMIPDIETELEVSHIVCEKSNLSRWPTWKVIVTCTSDRLGVVTEKRDAKDRKWYQVRDKNGEIKDIVIEGNMRVFDLE